MKQLIIAATFSVLVGNIATAADFKAPPPPPPAYDWTGWYVGLNAGYEFNNANDIVTTSTNTFAFAGSGGPVLASAITTLSTFTAPGGKNGAAVGGQVGYNWQFMSNWVAGIEADNEGVSGKGTSGSVSRLALTGLPNTLAQSTSVSSSFDYLGTVRGRLGFLYTPTLLIYGTGGLAYGGVKAETGISQSLRGVSTLTPPAWSGTGAFSDTRFGWTAGAGFEWMFFPNWTTKVEYLHYDLGSATYALTPLVTKAAAAAPFTANVLQSTASFSGDIIRAGLNYKF
jgi:outer membrane immunogenic protein